jgi:hypothetical protein
MFKMPTQPQVLFGFQFGKHKGMGFYPFFTFEMTLSQLTGGKNMVVKKSCFSETNC